MTAGAYCNRDVVTTGPETPVYDAAKLMREYHVGCLIVVEERNGENVPIGLVTDRDLVVEVLAQDVNPASVTVSDVMSADPVMVYEDDSLWDTIKKMNAHGIRRLPVITINDVLAGLLTIDDLLDLLSTELSQLTTVFIREQEREEESRP